MSCTICGSVAGHRTRIEFLPSKRGLEVTMCEGCMRDIAATTSINVVRLE